MSAGNKPSVFGPDLVSRGGASVSTISMPDLPDERLRETVTVIEEWETRHLGPFALIAALYPILVDQSERDRPVLQLRD